MRTQAVWLRGLGTEPLDNDAQLSHSKMRVLELTLALFLVLFHLNPPLSTALLPSLLLALTLPLLNVICGLVRL